MNKSKSHIDQIFKDNIADKEPLHAVPSFQSIISKTNLSKPLKEEGNKKVESKPNITSTVSNETLFVGIKPIFIGMALLALGYAAGFFTAHTINGRKEDESVNKFHNIMEPSNLMLESFEDTSSQKRSIRLTEEHKRVMDDNSLEAINSKENHRLEPTSVNVPKEPDTKEVEIIDLKKEAQEDSLNVFEKQVDNLVDTANQQILESSFQEEKDEEEVGIDLFPE